MKLKRTFLKIKMFLKYDSRSQYFEGFFYTVQVKLKKFNPALEIPEFLNSIESDKITGATCKLIGI